jgi:hypothetical protein
MAADALSPRAQSFFAAHQFLTGAATEGLVVALVVLVVNHRLRAAESRARDSSWARAAAPLLQSVFTAARDLRGLHATLEVGSPLEAHQLRAGEQRLAIEIARAESVLATDERGAQLLFALRDYLRISALLTGALPDPDDLFFPACIHAYDRLTKAFEPLKDDANIGDLSLPAMVDQAGNPAAVTHGPRAAQGFGA